MLRYVRVFIAATLFALPLVVALHTPAYACSCAALSLEQRVAMADLIIVGQTQSRQVVGPLPEPRPLSEPLFPSTTSEIETTVAVEEYLKGSGPATLGLRSYAFVSVHEGEEPYISQESGPGCQFAPALDTRYLFFLDRRQDGLPSTSSCGMSLPIDAWSESGVLAMIEQIRALLQPATATNEPGTPIEDPATATPVAGQLPSTGGGTGGAPLSWPVAAAAIAGGLLLASATLAGLRGRR